MLKISVKMITRLLTSNEFYRSPNVSKKTLTKNSFRIIYTFFLSGICVSASVYEANESRWVQ